MIYPKLWISTCTISPIQAQGGKTAASDPLDQQPPESGDQPESNRPQQSNPDSGDETTSQPANPEQDGPINTPPPSLSQSERDALEEQWQHRTAGAAQQAMQAGKLGRCAGAFF